MHTRSFIMKQRSRRLAVRSRRRREQLREMEEEEEHEAEQIRQRELEEQKQNIQTDSTIKDLETMIHADLSYNIPITYIDDIYGRSCGYSDTDRNHQTIQTTLFEYKKDYFRKNIVNYNKFKKGEIGSNEIPRYPIQEFNGEHLIEGNGGSEPILRSIATNILAETSDKFVALLDIVKQQNARIEELEQKLSDTIDTVSQLEDDWRDRMDEVYEANKG